MADPRPPADPAFSRQTGSRTPSRMPRSARATRLRRLGAGVAVTVAAALIAGCGQLSAGQDPFRAAPATSPAVQPSETASTPSPSPSPSTAATSESASPSPSASRSPAQSPTSSPKTDPSATKSQQQSADPDGQQSSSPKQSSTPTPTPGPSILAPEDSGKNVRELQARLKQIEWFQGKVTDYYGTETTAAVEGFQGKRELPVTGAVDQKTWDRLAAMTSQPTRNELFNVQPAGPAILEPGDTGTKVRKLQARLKQVAWFSGDVTDNYGPVTTAAVEGFQGKRGLPETGKVDKKTWQRLAAMTEQPTKAELNNSAGESVDNSSNLDSRCMSGRAICIDKTTNQLVWVIDGEPQLSFDVRFGAQDTPTREGAFSVGWKAEEWTSTLYDSEMPYSMFFSGGQAIHYSSDFAARGYSGASHGCVNVRDYEGIKTLFSQANVGDKVIVYRS